MNLLQKLARKIIKKSFELSISIIEYSNNMTPYKNKVSNLRLLKKGTLGKEIANCLDLYNLTLVPNFESHDLKHVLLDYKMTPEGEIRMQAFMIGNGNYSIPSFSILFFGAILLPDLWSIFYSDYKKGRASISIANWTIENYAHRNLIELRNEVNKTRVNTNTLTIKQITQIGAFSSIIVGVFGMLFCLPFLFSSNIADLIGAGFPFIGGAILVVGGLIVLSNLSQDDKNQSTIVSSI